MNRDIRRWFPGEGEGLLMRVGLRAGNLVLDFGCGKGCYAIAAAKVVGNRGIVYALDRSRYDLAELAEETSSRDLVNIVPIHSIDELKMALGMKSLNVVLLYDVIHGYYFTQEQRKNLLKSLATMVTRDGIVSIFPRHMSSPEIEGIKNQLRTLGFVIDRQMDTQLLHDGRHASGRIYNFRKEETAARNVVTASSAQ